MPVIYLTTNILWLLSANVHLESLEIYIANNCVRYQSNLGHKKTPFAILLHTPEPFLKECQILFEHFGLAEAGIQAGKKGKKDPPPPHFILKTQSSCSSKVFHPLTRAFPSLLESAELSPIDASIQSRFRGEQSAGGTFQTRKPRY